MSSIRVRWLGTADRQLQLNRGTNTGYGLPAASEIGLHAGGAVIVFAALLLFYGLYYPLHHDLAGSLLSGRLAVTLGDAFETYSAYFPPAEKVWFSFAARLSDVTGLRLDLTIVAMTGAMALFGAALAYRIRRVTVGASPVFFVLPLAVLVIAPILYKNIFGLREHIVAAGLWPYLVLRASDPRGTRVGWRLRLVLGLWVGATLLFKYLYSAVMALVELADALVQRRVMLLFRIENIAAGAIVFFYLFLWLGIDPGQRAVIGAMLGSIEGNLVSPRENVLNIAANLSFAVVLLIISRMAKMPARLLALALATVIGAVIVAWWQQRWYTHHLFPITMAYCAWWWMAAPKFRWWGHATVAAYLVTATIGPFLSTAAYRTDIAELGKGLREGGQSVAGKRIAIINPHPGPYNQYLASHNALRWTPLMNNAYVSAELKPLDIPANASKPAPPVKLGDPGTRMLHDQMLRLWEDMPPDAILIDRSDSWPLRYLRIDWMHAFSNDPRFAAIMARYRPVQVFNGKRVRFTYYVRAD